jgi:serine/threonine protein kinase
MLASLHHPNIASIFGLEETPECTFLVMELVEGDDLAVILKQGALPVDDAVEIAKQIAEGLEEAHECGIVHRDLKPANVKRTPDGKVKVLDFGLARAMAGQSSEDDQSISSTPTMTAAVTQAGVILGTAAYMSPEQARGLPVDRRTDIWAFGVILFELLTGRQLFAGETVSDTLAGILKTEPDWKGLPEGLPHQVERVLRRCLIKNQRQRLRDIGEARIRLEEPEAESGYFTGQLTPLVETTARWKRVVPWGLVVLAVAALGFMMSRGSGPAPAEEPIHLAVPSPEGAVFQLSSSFPSLPVISPDGKHVIFGARSEEDGAVQLYLRSLSSNQAVALDGTQNAQYPFWSPDSRWIAFFDRNEGLKKIPVGGGPDQTICAAGNGKGGSWSPDGTIVFAPEFNTPLHRVSALGGESTPVTDLDSETGFDSHRQPWFLPDGRHFLYLARATDGNDHEIRVASLDGDSTRVIMQNGYGVEFAAGHLLFMRKSVLMARPFDPDGLEFLGDPVLLADNILIIAGAGKAAFSSSVNGSLCYLQGQDLTSANIDWVDRKGNSLGELAGNAMFDTAVLSPDQRFVALTVIDPQTSNRDLWIFDIERNFKSRFTTDPGDERYPLWSPDGRYLYFTSSRGENLSVFRKAVNGTQPAEPVLDLGVDILIWAVSDDGQTLLYSTLGEGTSYDLWACSLDGEGEPRLLKRSAKEDGAARFSPDVRWISFWSRETGTGQVYLAPWPSLAFTRQVSTTSGTWAFWRQDSRELVFQDVSGTAFAVELTPEGEGVRIGAPQKLFDQGYVQLEGPLMDMMPDGERFIAIQTVTSDPPRFCDLIMNWPAKLAVQ